MGGKGRFVWHELLTTDVDAAKAFYTEVVGYKTQPFDGGSEPYTMFCVGEQPIGGLMTLPEEARAMGAPPHWLGHIGVPDVAATTKQVAELVGKVLVPLKKVPDVGTFSIIQDPQGAVFSAFTPVNDMTGHDGDPRNGDITWCELNTTDYEGAWKFYSTLFGWQATESMDMGPEHGTYFMFKHEAGLRAMGGMSNMAKVQSMPPNWLYYANVDDLDAALARVTSRGGKVLNGPMEVPGGDRVAQCMDPQGAAFALHSKA